MRTYVMSTEEKKALKGRLRKKKPSKFFFSSVHIMYQQHRKNVGHTEKTLVGRRVLNLRYEYLCHFERLTLPERTCEVLCFFPKVYI